MVKQNVHFFGDSHTEGLPLKNTPHVWPKLIAEALKDYNYKNYAQGGASPQFMVNQVIKALPNVKSGDEAFSLETMPDRMEVHSQRRDEAASVTWCGRHRHGTDTGTADAGTADTGMVDTGTVDTDVML